MGYQYVALVEAAGLAGRLDRLTHGARLCLFVMAHNAHDTGTRKRPRGIYFNGWDHLAHVALGRSDYDENAQRMVGRYVGELVDAGMIERRGRLDGKWQGPMQYALTISTL